MKLGSWNDLKAETAGKLEHPGKQEQPKLSLLQHIGVPMPSASRGDLDRTIIYRLNFADLFSCSVR
jgi:hypothetical protein